MCTCKRKWGFYAVEMSKEPIVRPKSLGISTIYFESGTAFEGFATRRHLERHPTCATDAGNESSEGCSSGVELSWSCYSEIADSALGSA
ncbi:hypothetical protein JTE90_000833 [Oedothorax gibbosus]|uniref:Uncharacterized protein n=1 Tax=Oedothorax gibbosus TaxID=931172 RepID=A0AAV6VSR9_9ARAC|nr:hypothetical protein JTE90_000833 [Oedothorax gibbosus]